MTAASTEDNGISKTPSLTPEAKEILHQSIIHYLYRNGFSKTLKRFQSEAQIQNDTWKASSINLEEIYCKYINERRHTQDDQEGANKDGNDLGFANEKTTTSKKKKKSSAESDKGGEIAEDNAVEPETKGKKKKKSKCDLTEEAQLDAPEKPVDGTMNGLEVNEPKKKSKDKKKKSNQEEMGNEVEPVKHDPENGDVAKEDKKSSKKRKRLLSDENQHEPVKMENKNTIEESKQQKTEASKDDKDAEIGAYENSDKQLNGGEKSDSGPQKSVKKQRNGSTEPKTINAFQRVKIDEVKFAHEKLQDNSYWAKDGADIGYGAKAQEVLGQVRGRDFRHEKTKKKRGSYRGGQIDLQSHSIKFNYSDED